MLPRGEHVQHVFYTGANSLLFANLETAKTQGRKLFIDCSTIDAAITREVGEQVKQSGLGDFADAAVSVRDFSSLTTTKMLLTQCVGWTDGSQSRDTHSHDRM